MGFAISRFSMCELALSTQYGEDIVEYDTIRQHDADQHKVVDADRHVVVADCGPQRIDQLIVANGEQRPGGACPRLAIINASGVWRRYSRPCCLA